MIRLLVADDEKFERDAIAELVARDTAYSFETFTAQNGQQAVELALEHRVQIAFMDIKMPLLNGIDAARQIKAALPECHIVIQTGYTYFMYAKEAVSVGVDEFLVKPMTDEDILTVVHRMAEKIESRLSERDAEARMAGRLSQTQKYIRAELLTAIAFSNADKTAIDEYLSFMDLTFDKAYAVIVRAEKADDAPHEREAALLRQFMEGLERTLPQYTPCCAIRNRKLYGMLLVNERVPDLAGALQAVKNACGEGGDTLQVLTSALITRAEDVFPAFAELRYRRRECPLPGEGAERIDFFQMENKVCAYLESARVYDAMRLADELLDAYSREERFRQRAYSLLAAAARSLPSTRREDLHGDIYDRVFRAETPDAVKQTALLIMEEMIDAALSETGRGQTWAASTAQYIADNFSGDITLDDLARRAGFSAFYFSKLFKDTFGQTFTEYLTNCRIAEAKRLLAGGVSVKEACYKAGYSEPNYFARVFRRVTGVSPSQYQKSAASANLSTPDDG